MIAYFSGTGNSRYVARRLADSLKEDTLFMTGCDPRAITFKGKTFGLVFPVYSWGVPPLVTDFIKSLSEGFVSGLREAKTPVWAVMTCGDETGDAPEILKASLEIRGLRLAGLWSVIMPNTYVLLPGFDVDPTEVELRKIEEAPARVDAIASSIKSGKFVADVHIGSMPRLKTRLMFPLFRHAGIFPSWWRFTEECVSCGKCAAACPVGNVEMVAGHPRWHEDCVSCLACYHACPVHAVAYGIMTGGKGQYHCPLH